MAHVKRVIVMMQRCTEPYTMCGGSKAQRSVTDMTPFVPISFAKSFVKRTPESRVRLVVVVDRKPVVASDQLSIWIDRRSRLVLQF